MILSGRKIREELGRTLVIDPFDEERLNPASYDLTLGDLVRCYETPGIHDVKDEPTKFRHALIGPEGFVVHPGRGYLMHTVERIATETYVPVLDGKSSIGRLFVQVHVTAGYGDPGFNGQYTLEVVAAAFSVRLYARMRIAQVRFHTMLGAADLYQGHYRGESSFGPVPSAIWKSFQKKDPQ